MNKFTAGTWKAQSIKNTPDTRHGRVYVERAETARTKANPDICTVHAMGDDGRPGGETDANILLISAAPDLLAALEAADMWIIGTGSYIRHDAHAIAIREVVRTAIAKARGE